MGKELSEDEKNKTAWDPNAITPGTPFMFLLAASLRYWVAKKINSDAGWKQVCTAIAKGVSILMSLPRCKLLFLTLVFLERVSTRLWITSGDKGRILDMTLIRVMLFMAWLVVTDSSFDLRSLSFLGC